MHEPRGPSAGRGGAKSIRIVTSISTNEHAWKERLFGLPNAEGNHGVES